MNDYLSLDGVEQRTLDNLSTAVLVFDNDLRLKYINTAGEMLLALSSRQVVGQRVEELIHCPGGVVESNLIRARDSGQPFTEREHPMQLGDGNQITIDCTVIPVRQENGSMEYLVEMQQVDRQIRITREERLLNRNQTTRALVRSLAHEVKNPLGGLRGAAQLLERELPDESLKEYTQVIIQEADRLQKLVDSMLGPNRMPKREQISIHQVLERVCRLIQAESKGIHIVKDYDPSIPAMLGDFDQLIQAFLNIMRNGARAAGSHGQLGIKTRILRQFTIGAARHRLVILVELSDNGPGISEEMQERLFFPMVSGSNDGMGLGLSISQELINRHKGLIEFSSKPGETVFSVLLPLEQADG